MISVNSYQKIIYDIYMINNMHQYSMKMTQLMQYIEPVKLE